MTGLILSYLIARIMPERELASNRKHPWLLLFDSMFRGTEFSPSLDKMLQKHQADRAQSSQLAAYHLSSHPRLDQCLMHPGAENIAPKTDITFTLFTSLPFEIQRIIWQQAQPQRVLELAFDNETLYNAIEEPLMIPGCVSQICYLARQETMQTFNVISETLPFISIPSQWNQIKWGSKTVFGAGTDLQMPPRQMKNRVAWFEAGRDIVYWNGNFPTRRNWNALEENSLAKGQITGPINRGAIENIMIRADLFSHGFWNMKQIISLFPKLKVVSVLTGGMSLYEDEEASRRRPICTLVDLGSDSQKDKVSRAIPNFKEPRHASKLWRRVRQHCEDPKSNVAIRQRTSEERGVGYWELPAVEYCGLCRTKVEWEGDLESFKQGYLAYKWQTSGKVVTRQLKSKPDDWDVTKQSVTEFFLWKKRVLDSLPRFRQVFILRMHTYKSEAFGLEEVTF